MPEIVAPFSNFLPVRVRFGDGVALELPDIVAGTGVSSALVVVDAGLEGLSPAVAAVVGALEASGIGVVRSPKGPGEPRGSDVDAAAVALRQSGAGIVVALGGGSVIDTAKAARLCAQQGLE